MYSCSSTTVQCYFSSSFTLDCQGQRAHHSKVEIPPNYIELTGSDEIIPFVHEVQISDTIKDMIHFARADSLIATVPLARVFAIVRQLGFLEGDANDA